MGLKSVQAQLLASMADEDHFVDGLVTESARAARLRRRAGRGRPLRRPVPPAGGHARRARRPSARRLAVGERAPPGRLQHRLAGERLPRGRVATRTRASGLLAISISQAPPRATSSGSGPRSSGRYVGRRPTQADRARRDGRHGLHPRTSVRGLEGDGPARSLPWRPGELEAAVELRDAIVGIVLRKAEELAAAERGARRGATRSWRPSRTRSRTTSGPRSATSWATAELLLEQEAPG